MTINVHNLRPRPALDLYLRLHFPPFTLPLTNRKEMVSACWAVHVRCRCAASSLS